MKLPDLDSFSDRVYWLTDQIPEGRVATYGQIAFLAGTPRAARAVGALMKTSRSIGLDLPWHRVINASGGISYKGEVERPRLQRTLLKSEGVLLSAKDTCDLSIFRWEPDHDFWSI